MSINVLLKRSNTASKRPTAAQLDIGELSLNYDANTAGVFFEDSAGNVRKVGPVEVSASAPNSTPAGSSGNSLGELWYDTGTSNLKIWNGSSFVNATNSVPVSTGVSGLGAGVATFLATPSSANLAAAVTNETGSGALVFGTSPTIITSLLAGSTTFSLINTTATTVNFAGAATTLTVGSGAGLTTLNGKVGVGTTPSGPYVLEVGGATTFGRAGSGGDTHRFFSRVNWNFPEVGIIRNASNASAFKMLSFLLDGDTFENTNLYNNYNFALSTSGAPTSGSTSTGLSANLNLYGPNDLVLLLNSSEKLRVRGDGNVGLGTSGANNVSLYIRNNITGNTNSFSTYAQQTIASDVTASASIFRSNPTTAAASFTLSVLNHFYASQTAFGAGSTVTSQVGYLASSSMTGATNNYGFFAENFNMTSPGKFSAAYYSAMNQGTGGGASYAMYSAGNAPSYHAGNLGIGTTNPVKQFQISDGSEANVILERTGAATNEKMWRQYVSSGDDLIFSRLNDAATSEGAFYKVVGGTGLNITSHIWSQNNSELFRVSANGNMGIGITTVSTGPSLVVQGTGNSAQGRVEMHAWSGSAASPTETVDWPMPVLCLRGYDNYFQQSMLSFGYPDDAAYQTGKAVWVTRLYDLRGGTPAPVSSSANTALYLAGPSHILIDPTGNVKIGGTANRATTEGTNALVLFNGTAPVGTLADGVSFYSSAGEARVMDAAGNSTLLSPHDKETNEWIYDSVDTRTGKRLRIRMEALMRFINEHFGLDLVEEFMDEVPA